MAVDDPYQTAYNLNQALVQLRNLTFEFVEVLHVNLQKSRSPNLTQVYNKSFQIEAWHYTSYNLEQVLWPYGLDIVTLHTLMELLPCG